MNKISSDAVQRLLRIGIYYMYMWTVHSVSLVPRPRPHGAGPGNEATYMCSV